MNQEAVVDCFARLSKGILITIAMGIHCLTLAQNEFFEQASRDHIIHEFSLETSFGQADFALYAPENEARSMKRVQEILINIAPKIFNYFKYVPESRTHVRLDFSAARANGSATVFPRNMIVLNMFPPIGSEHLVTSDDWLQGLVLHELVHIVHLDRTDGILDVITDIFGAVGKLGGVAPRWFIEGVAVWAETYFTKGGRLRNDGLVAQAKYFLALDDFCHTIDCLDAPGEYPFGNFSYWVGGLFLDYLESLKAGTLACIVRVNSNNIPFFLRGAIEACTGRRKTVEGLFQEFRSHFLKEIPREDSFLRGRKQLIDVYEESQPLFERGYELTDHHLYWVSQNRDHVRLKQYDLTKGDKKDLYRNYHIDQILANEQRIYLSTSDYRRLWVQKKIRTLKESVLARGDWLVTYKGERAFWRFQDNAWRLFQAGKEVDALPQFVDLVDARDHLIVIRRGEEYWLYQFERQQVLRKSRQSFRLMSHCEQTIFLKENDDMVIIDRDGQYTLNNKWTKDVIDLRTNRKHTVYRLSSMHEHLVARPLGCRKLARQIKQSGQTRVIRRRATRVEPLKPAVIKEHERDRLSYPQAKHFKPHWWFFSYLAGDVITQLTLSTSINDPLDRHQLNLNVQYFDGINKVHPTGRYTYNWSGTELGFGVSQSYIQNISRSSPDQDSSYFAFIGRNFFWRNLVYRPSFNISYFEQSDIISSRKGQQQTFVQGLALSPLFLDDFFQGLRFTSLTRHFSVDEGLSYFGQELHFQSQFQPLTRFYTTLQASYGKLYKDTLRDGILYSGSANDYDVNTLHEFIGINPNAAFGNEVVTSRFLMNYEVWRVQRGYGFVPFSVRTLNALAGSDYLKTDFIYTPARYIRDSFSQSYYVGARANITLAYFIPAQFDLLRARVNPGAGAAYDETRFFLRGSFPF